MGAKILPRMIQVKNTTVLAGMLLHKFDPKLVEVVSWIVDEFGLLFTESWRLANGMHFHIQVHPRTIQKRKELLQ